MKWWSGLLGMNCGVLEEQRIPYGHVQEMDENRLLMKVFDSMIKNTNQCGNRVISYLRKEFVWRKWCQVLWYDGISL